MPASLANDSDASSSATPSSPARKRRDVVAVETGGGGDVGEHLGVADVASLDEVGGEQALLDVVLRARRTVLLGVPQQAVGVAGVRPQRPVEVERQARPRPRRS